MLNELAMLNDRGLAKELESYNVNEIKSAELDKR